MSKTSRHSSISLQRRSAAATHYFEPQLSPDLKHVVVTVQDSTADGGRTHLWLLSTDGSPYRQLTFNQGNLRPKETRSIFRMQAQFCSSPVARQVQALSSAARRRRIVCSNLERVPSPNEPQSAVGIMSYSISPDGHTIAVVATDPEPAPVPRDHKDKRMSCGWNITKPSIASSVDTKTWKSREVPALADMDSVAWSDSRTNSVLTHARLRDLGPSASDGLVTEDPSQQKRWSLRPPGSTRVAFTSGQRSCARLQSARKIRPKDVPTSITSTSTAPSANLTVNLKIVPLPRPADLLQEDDHSCPGEHNPRMKRTSL
jgi:hypothetical protein